MADVDEKEDAVHIQPGPGKNVVYAQPNAVPGAGTQIVMMPRPAPIPGVPAGLEYLSQIDQLLIHQQVELLEVVTSWEIQNKYQVKNSVGQQVFFAMEESDLCMRHCCRGRRGFVMHITDNLGQEVIRVNREFKCCAGCCWCAYAGCCQMIVTVEAPVGVVIGSTVQQYSKCEPNFEIRDGSDNHIFNIDGPCCRCQAVCCTDDLNFVITTSNDQEVGRISKQWAGIGKEMFTKASNFGVSFPVDLDVRMKAVLLGTVFLIDFMFFEKRKRRRHRFGIQQGVTNF